MRPQRHRFGPPRYRSAHGLFGVFVRPGAVVGLLPCVVVVVDVGTGVVVGEFVRPGPVVGATVTVGGAAVPGGTGGVDGPAVGTSVGPVVGPAVSTVVGVAVGSAVPDVDDGSVVGPSPGGAV